VAPPAPEPVKAAEEVVFQAAPPAPAAASDDLVSDKARHDIDDALAGLDFDAASSVPAAAPAPIAPLNGRSIEAIFDKAVRETFDPVLTGWLHEQADVIVDRMKPAIREWMEENLPSMLKAAVEAEVARAVRNRTKR
jgi:cell pole-organizing protein PopZ